MRDTSLPVSSIESREPAGFPVNASSGPPWPAGDADPVMTDTGLSPDRAIDPAPSLNPSADPDPSPATGPSVTDDPGRYVNIAHRLRRMVRRHPHKRAVVFPAGWDGSNGRVAYTHLTFVQLDRESDYLAHGLESIGILKGTRTILMAPPSLEFFCLVFALFKIGAIPVIVDPGMGMKRMVECLEESRPEAFIGIAKAHLLRFLFPAKFRTVNKWVSIGHRLFGLAHSLDRLRDVSWEPHPLAQTRPEDVAAILFTTGSTGPAKGVIYTHGIFDAQVERIQEHFQFQEDDIDLPTFPLFSLFDPALGMTAIIPDMDPTRPAEADPEKIIESIFDHGVTNMFASPALLRRLGEYGEAANQKLPTLRRVISAGAPVSPSALDMFAAMLPETARIFTPYGATEAMPVLCADHVEILSETRKFSEKGYGMCVGRPVGDMEVRIIRITDAAIEIWSDQLMVPDGEIGEITVRGSVVTQRYFERPHDDHLSKIQDGAALWHRMGDLGWRDNKGRVWFCGRKSHRVVTENGTLFSVPCEAIFNNHAYVYRSALVGLGDPPRQKPVICIELRNGGRGMDREEVKKELLNMASQNAMTEDIRTVFFHDGFPVDIRHNAKIFRERLRDWAEAQAKAQQTQAQQAAARRK